MMVCFVSNQRPYSIQADGKEKFKLRLINEFDSYRHLYDNIPLCKELYSKIIYIHMRKTNIDVDNMSKPIVDAFRSIIYSDDDIINHRICTKIRLQDFETLNIDLSCLPTEIAEKLDEFFESGSEHILYYEVGEYSNSMVKVGEAHEVG